jgi:FHA domain/zinc-ribbon domain
MSHVYCPECGFQNPEAANYCSKCGAALVREAIAEDTTMAFEPGELEESSPLEDLGMEGPALVLRRNDGRFVIEDQGSLNGTFVNRRRIENAELADGDELQIGKYRLTFLQK